MSRLADVVHFLVTPLNVLGLLLLLSFASAWARRPRAARATVTLAFALYAVTVLTPLPDTLLRGLEDRFPRADVAFGEVAGAIVLGGAAGSGDPAYMREPYAIGDAAERLTAAVALRRAGLRVVFSGGGGSQYPGEITEADATRRILADIGADPADYVFEERSLNTWENARFTRALPLDFSRPWLLVTSASHMPRAMGAFRKAGIDVRAWPVDYHAPPAGAAPLFAPAAGRFAALDTGVREWAGLVAYRLLGRSDALFPAPKGR